MTENELLLKDFRPGSTLVAKRTPISKAKFPAIEIHSHMRKAQDIRKIVKNMDQIGIELAVNLDGGRNLNVVKESVERFEGKYPGRFATFCNIDFSDIDSSDFKSKTRNYIRECVKMGVKGIKLFKENGLMIRDLKGKLVMPDDERMRVIWEAAAEENIPVLYHIADPEAFFRPFDNKNERIEQLFMHPNWSFYGSEFPTRDELFECQQKMLEKNPQTMFILPHIASNPENLEYVSRLLDTYTNFVMDLSGRVGDLGRQPYTARKFLIKYADRTLFGTDGSGGVEPKRFYIYFRFLETDDENFLYRIPNERFTVRWRVHGVFLPDDVLKKIYYDNAVKVLGKA